MDKEPGEEFRTSIKLDLMENTRGRMLKTGTWTYATGINYTKSESARQEETTQKLENKTLQVVTTLVSKSIPLRLNILLLSFSSTLFLM